MRSSWLGNGSLLLLLVGALIHRSKFCQSQFLKQSPQSESNTSATLWQPKNLLASAACSTGTATGSDKTGGGFNVTCCTINGRNLIERGTPVNLSSWTYFRGADGSRGTPCSACDTYDVIEPDVCCQDLQLPSNTTTTAGMAIENSSGGDMYGSSLGSRSSSSITAEEPQSPGVVVATGTGSPGTTLLDLASLSDVFVVAPGGHVVLHDMHITGALLPTTSLPSAFLALSAFKVTAAAQDGRIGSSSDSSSSSASSEPLPPPPLVLCHLAITTPSCDTLSQHQAFACSFSPSPNFTVTNTSLVVHQYRTSLASITNVTLTCSGAPLPCPCLATKVTNGSQLLEAMEELDSQVASMFSDHGIGYQAPALIYLDSDLIVLTPTSIDDEGSYSDEGRQQMQQQQPRIISIATARFVLAGRRPTAYDLKSGLTATPEAEAAAAAAAGTVLDLAGSSNFVEVQDSASVQLCNMTLRNLPRGPATGRRYSFLTAFLWTFSFPRFVFGRQMPGPVLALINVVLELPREELALWFADTLGPDSVPEVLQSDLCVMDATDVISTSSQVQAVGAPGSRGVALLWTYAVSWGRLIEWQQTLFTSAGKGPWQCSTCSNGDSFTAMSGSGKEYVTSASGSSCADYFSSSPPAIPSNNMVEGSEYAHMICPLESQRGVPQRPSLCGYWPKGVCSVVVRLRFTLTVSDLDLPGGVTDSMFFEFSDVMAKPVCTWTPVNNVISFSKPNQDTINTHPAFVITPTTIMGQFIPPVTLNVSQLAGAIRLVNTSTSNASLTIRGMVLVDLPPAGFFPTSTIPRPPWPISFYSSPSPPPPASPFHSTAASATLSVTTQARRRNAMQLEIPFGRRLMHDSSQAASQQTAAAPTAAQSGSTSSSATATQGLDLSLSNFTSCLWTVEFDRVGALARHNFLQSGCSSSSSATLDEGRPTGLPYVYLDGVVLVVPQPEMDFLVWTWAHNSTAAATRDGLAVELDRMLGSSRLSAESLSVLMNGSPGDSSNSDNVGADISKSGTRIITSSLTFERLWWCGVEGRNVTFTSWPSQQVRDKIQLGFVQLDLPVSYPVVPSPPSPSPYLSPYPSQSPPPLQPASAPGTPFNVDIPVPLPVQTRPPGEQLSASSPAVHSPSPNQSPTAPLHPPSAPIPYFRNNTQQLLTSAIPGTSDGDSNGGLSGKSLTAIIAASCVCSAMFGAASLWLVAHVHGRRLHRQGTSTTEHKSNDILTNLTWTPSQQLVSSDARTLLSASECRPGHTHISPASPQGDMATCISDSNRFTCPTDDKSSDRHQQSMEGTASPRWDTAAGVPVVQRAAAGEIHLRIVPSSTPGEACRKGSYGLNNEDISLSSVLGPQSEETSLASLSLRKGTASIAAAGGIQQPGSGSDAISSAAMCRARRNNSCSQGTSKKDSSGTIGQTLRDQYLHLYNWFHKAQRAAAGVAGGLRQTSSQPTELSSASSHEVTKTARTASKNLHHHCHGNKTAMEGGSGADDAIVIGGSGVDSSSVQPTCRQKSTSINTNAEFITCDMAAQTASGLADTSYFNGGSIFGEEHSSEGGRMLLLGELGRGAQGVVYRGIWKGLAVAVKNLLLQNVTGASPPQAYVKKQPAHLFDATQHAIREAAISASVSHPNVVATYAYLLHRLGEEAAPGHLSATEAQAQQEPRQGPGSADAQLEVWKLTLIQELCDGNSLLHCLERGTLARCSVKRLATEPSTQSSGDGTAQCSLLLMPSPLTSAAAAASSAAEACKASLAPGSASLSSTGPTVGSPSTPLLITNTGKPTTAVSCGSAAVKTSDATPAASDVGGLTSNGNNDNAGSSDTSSNGKRLSTVVVLSVALQVARGLAHLHSRAIVHADVSSANILLKRATSQMTTADSSTHHSSAANVSWAVGTRTRAVSPSIAASAVASGADTIVGAAAYDDDQYVYGYIAKVGDFGLSGWLNRTEEATHVSGPARRSSLYSAPELVRDGRSSPAGDVYAFAVVLWELVHATPLPELLRTSRPEGVRVQNWLVQQSQLDPEAAEALPPELLVWPHDTPPGLSALAGECLRAEPSARPCMAQVCERLWQLLMELSPPS